MFPGDLELDALFKDHGMSCTVIEDLLTLEWVDYQRCTLGQLPLSGIRTFHRRKCVRFLQDLVAAAVLPPRSADFPLQLLDFAHAWSDRRDNDIHIFNVLSLAAAVSFFIKADPGWAQEPRYTRPLPDLLAAIAGLLARRQLHNAPTMHSAWTIQQITRAEFRILEVLNYEFATPTPAACIEIFERRFSHWEEQQIQLPHHSHIPAAPPIVFADGAPSHCRGPCPEPFLQRDAGPVKLEPPLGSYPSPSGYVWNWLRHINGVTVAHRSFCGCAQLNILSQFCACCSPVTLEVYLALSLHQ